MIEWRRRAPAEAAFELAEGGKKARREVARTDKEDPPSWMDGIPRGGARTSARYKPVVVTLLGR